MICKSDEFMRNKLWKKTVCHHKSISQIMNTCKKKKKESRNRWNGGFFLSAVHKLVPKSSLSDFFLCVCMCVGILREKIGKLNENQEIKTALNR